MSGSGQPIERTRAAAPIEYGATTDQPSQWQNLPPSLLKAIAENAREQGQPPVDEQWASFFVRQETSPHAPIFGWATNGQRVTLLQASQSDREKWTADLRYVANERNNAVDVRTSLLPPPTTIQSTDTRMVSGASGGIELSQGTDFPEILSQLPIRSQDEVMIAVPRSKMTHEHAETWLWWGEYATQLILYDRRSSDTIVGLRAERTAGVQSGQSGPGPAQRALEREPWRVTRIRVRVDLLTSHQRTVTSH